MPASNNASAQRLLASVLGEMGRPEDALARLQHAVTIEPNNARAHGDLAETLHQLSRPHDAIRHYRQAL
ncbi:MAG: tetratricopeptide repeat protein, partial [Deltaproteobacteria bacterium]|nr:tetratricopeptide repeat protein [Deltaproteobacteria bacterium]